jgi:hypothetical protein
MATTTAVPNVCRVSVSPLVVPRRYATSELGSAPVPDLGTWTPGLVTAAQVVPTRGAAGVSVRVNYVELHASFGKIRSVLLSMRVSF